MDNLRIYQTALSLVTDIYKLTQSNRRLSRDFALVDQIRRASISIMANIAEGYYRTKRESLNYLRISSGSANEVVSLLQVIKNVYGIETSMLQDSFRKLGKQINAYSKTVSNRKPTTEN